LFPTEEDVHAEMEAEKNWWPSLKEMQNNIAEKRQAKYLLQEERSEHFFKD